MPPPTRLIKRGMFGPPTLQWLKNNGAASSGYAKWVREWTRYGEWTASLTPGAQSGDDYAAVEFAVNNMRLKDLESIRYIYRMGSTEVIAPNVAIHVYDPNDIDNRADITLSHTHDDLGKTTLTWYKFDLVPATTEIFYYGNNIPTTTGLVAHGTAGNLYTLTEFQEDAVFSTYVISKITIEYGYYSTGTIGEAHIAKIAVNEEDILLQPSFAELDEQSVIQAQTGTEVPIATASTSEVALAANPARVYAFFQNDSDTVMYIREGETAVEHEGKRLGAEGGWHEINKNNLYRGVVNVICSATGKVLMVTEGV